MHLYVGTKGHVCALDIKSGTELWRADLGHGVVGSEVSLIVADGRVFAGAGGYITALDAQTGKTLWSNDLKGLGSTTSPWPWWAKASNTGPGKNKLR